LWVVCPRRLCHVSAEAMREVRRIDSRVHPASYAIGQAKRCRTRVIHVTDEERVVAGVWSRGWFRRGEGLAVVRIEVEDVLRRVKWSVLADEGCRNVVGESGRRGHSRVACMARSSTSPGCWVWCAMRGNAR
jgi:hypothetical protein